jgi:serine/threonine-protein kinase
MAVDQRSDVFALGVVLWEALCGRRLYLRAAEMDSLRAIVEEPVTPPSKLVPTSARLERIVLQALEKDPAKRFQNASEMALALERHAFASDGFNPLQISTAMKTLFASDYARWNRTVAAAMDTEGPPDAWSDTAGTFLAPGAIDLRSDGSKVVPNSDLTPATAIEEGRNDSKSVPTAVTAADDSRPDNRSAPSTSIVGQPVTIAPQNVRQVRLGASIAVVGAAVAVVLSVFTLLRPARTVTVIRPAPAAASRGTPPIEAMPGTPAPEEGPAVTSNTGPTVEPVATPPSDTAPAKASAGTGAGVSVSAPPADKTRPKARPVLRKRFDRRAPRPPTSPSDKPPATDAATFSPAAGPPTASPPTAPAPPAVATPAAPVKPGPLTTPAAAIAPAPAMTPVAAPASTSAATRCSIRLGSTPWAEVWIDGQNTKGHTPYSDEITCGKHELLFKRDDLGLTKAATVTLQPGAIFKRSFALDGK